MINLDLHFTWHTYFCIVALVTIWNLGFTAITRKGKLLYPILKFFTRKKEINVPLEHKENLEIDAELSEKVHSAQHTSTQEAIVNLFISNLKEHRKIFTNYFIPVVVENIFKKETNQYYFKKEVDIFPDFIKDPVVACITCMASVHGCIIYLLHCYLLHHSWNPIEQIAISVPVAFLGEFFWKLKCKIEK